MLQHLKPTSKKPVRWLEMTTNRKNTKNKTIQTSKTIEELEKENKAIQQDIQVLKKELTYFKEYAVELESKLNTQKEIVQKLKLHNKILTSERNELQQKLDHDNTILTGLLAEQHENRVVSAMGSFLGDD